MGNNIYNSKNVQQSRQHIFNVFEEIIDSLRDTSCELDYDIALLAVDSCGGCLETPEAFCHYLLDAVKETSLNMFCGIVNAYEPPMPMKRESFTGIPVRLSQLILTAIEWEEQKEYDQLINHLAALIATLIDMVDKDTVRLMLKGVIAERYCHSDTSRATLTEVIHNVLNFIQGRVFTLEKDIIAFIHHNHVLLDELSLFNLILVHDTNGTPFKLDLQGSIIPYGWSPEDVSGDKPIRLTDLVTHACTWTGDEEQQEAILFGIAGVLSCIVRDTNKEHWYQALVTCRDTLHNTHLH